MPAATIAESVAASQVAATTIWGSATVSSEPAATIDGAAPASGAKKGSVFRRCFHDPDWRRAARSRIGFAQDALPLMASLPYLGFELDRLTTCGSTVV